MNEHQRITQQLGEILTEHYPYEHEGCDDSCGHIQTEMATRAHCIYMIHKMLDEHEKEG